jgi:hypothetical protein
MLSGLSLTSFSPYVGRYVGYAVKQGNLGLDLEYKVTDRKLQATNQIALQKFLFGERVESEEATSLPVPVALAVMRDASGDIEIGLPISGNLDDPSFSVLSLLGRATVNLISKVALSPFGAVAGLIDTSADDLRRVPFAPGSAELEETEVNQLSAVAALFEEQPSLLLEIRGQADPEVDGMALQVQRVEEAVRLAAFESFSGFRQRRLGGPENVELDPEERLKGLEALYEERTGGSAATLVPDSTPDMSETDRVQTLSQAIVTALAEQVEVDPAALVDLAQVRAKAIQTALLATDLVEAERLLLMDVSLGAFGSEGRVPAELSLGVK